ncbi:GNAT family N-acetyltransferase [Heyndrickxia sp. FSL W8-0423]|uniref:GNAT family N-acetyltransferase n=1 Tax=Heyndrickxia sp. FSL W8-0423 TaxID=2921601 RepID=UPI0030F97037
MIKVTSFPNLQEFVPIKKLDDYTVSSFDGEWFIYGKDNSKDKIVGRYYFGNNEFSGLNECYVDLLFGDCHLIDNSFIQNLSQYLNKRIYELEYEIHLFFLEYTNTLNGFERLSVENILKLDVYSVVTLVEKDLFGKTKERIKGEFTVRTFEEKDSHNVISCLVDSYKMGISLGGFVDLVDFQRLEQNIVQYYNEFFLSKNTIIFIAEKNGEFVGHITFEMHDEKAVLVDSYVLNKFSGNGVYDLLKRKFENFCISNEITVLEGSVEPHSEKSLKILENLKQNGWREKSYIGRFNIK